MNAIASPNAAAARAGALERRWNDAMSLLDRLLELPESERQRWLQAQSLDAELTTLLQLMLDGAQTLGVLDVDVSELPLPWGEDALWQRRLGPWRILRPIGAGGVASVFLGERADGRFEQSVAIKILRTGVLDPHERERFARERQLLARFEHPGIARLIDGGVSPEGAPYLVLEFVDGLPITAWCDQQRLDPGARLRLFLDVCAAVQFAHQHLVVHRDLKPSNILVDRSGRVKLLDFGIAKLLDGTEVLTHTEARRLTPAYAAPEQIQGGPVSTAVDVYALGLLLHELLVGSRPLWLADGVAQPLSLQAARAEGCVLQARGGAPSSQLVRALRGDLQAIVDTALKSAPEQRYASVAALAQDVACHLEGTAVSVRAGVRWYRAACWLRRHARVAAAGALVLLAVAIAATYSLRQARVAQSQASRAQDVQAFLVDLLEVAAVDGERTAAITVDQLLSIGAQRARDAFPASPQTRAQLLATLGRLLHRQGRLSEAERALLAAQALERAQPGTRDTGRLETRVALALIHAEQKPGVAARRELEALLAEQRAASAPAIAISHNLQRIGFLHSSAGQHDLALSRLREAVALAASGPERGAALLALGDGQARAGDDPAAMTTWRLALRAVPARSIEYSRVQRSIGYALLRVSEWAGAQAALEESLDLQATLMPADHPHTAETLIALGSLSHERGRFELSRGYFERALRMRERLYGFTGVETAEPLIGMGGGALVSGDAAQAVRLMRDAQQRVASVPREQEHVRAWVLGNLSAALRKNGEIQEALAVAEEAHAINLREFGVAHDKSVASRISMERARHALGQHAEALRHLGDARRHMTSASAVAQLDLLSGHLRLEQGDLDAARADLETVLALIPSATNATLRADAEVGLADVALAQHDAGAARRHVLAAHEILQPRLPADHPRLLALEQRLRR